MNALVGNPNRSIRTSNMISSTIALGLSYFIMIFDPNLTSKVIFLALVLIVFSNENFKTVDYKNHIINLKQSIFLYYIAFIFYALLSVLFLPDMAHPIKLWLELTSASLSVFLILKLIKFSESQFEAWVVVIFFCLTCWGALEKINMYGLDPLRLNRLSTTIGIIFIPSIFVALSMRVKYRRLTVFGIILLMLISLVAFIRFGYGDSIKLTLVVGVGALILHYILGRRAYFIYAVTITIILVIQPLWGEILGYFLTSEIATNFKESALIRLHAWQSFGAIAREVPFFGIGFGGSQSVSQTTAYLSIDPKYYLGFAVHPHDNFLQIWVELGAVGVLLFWLFLMEITRLMSNLPKSVSPAAFAYLCSTTAAGLVFDSAWRHWWISAIGIGAVMISFLSSKEKSLSH